MAGAKYVGKCIAYPYVCAPLNHSSCCIDNRANGARCGLRLFNLTNFATVIVAIAVLAANFRWLRTRLDWRDVRRLCRTANC